MHKYYKGAASLFIVIFFSLLITVFTVSFVRVALKGLQQATTTDLSKNAYDSAQAGVEDAKRALIRLGYLCGPSGNQQDCTLAKEAMQSGECNKALQGIVSDTTKEVKIQQNSNDLALDQAYTCVTVTKNTIDYLGALTADESKTVPLIGEKNFDRIKIEWFDQKNTGSTSTDLSLLKHADLVASSPLPLLSKSDYPANRPPIFRAHLVQVGKTYNPADIEGSSNTATMYFYPVSGAITPDTNNPVSLVFSDGGRQVQDKKPTLLDCQKSLALATYACAVELVLPNEVTADSTALLQVAAFYNAADYKITLCKGTCSDVNNTIKLNGVQPMIDSTGRANDLFRRVQVRVENVDAFPYPEGALESAGNLCKNFYLTDNTADYWQSTSCSP